MPDEDRNHDVFINALADVDILKVEAVGMVIGRAVGALHKGMLDAGVAPDVAAKIINSAVDALFHGFLSKMAARDDQGES